MRKPENPDFLRSQLHIYSGLKGLQPVKDRAVFAPRRAGPAWDGFDLGDSLAFHFEIDFCIAIRRSRAGVPKQVADGREIYARLQKGDGRTVPNAVGVQSLLAEIRRTSASHAETPGEDMADSETG